MNPTTDTLTEQCFFLSESRRADRVTMAETVAGLCRAHGVPHEIDWSPPLQGRAVTVEIKAPDGLAGRVAFDGKSALQGTYLVHWYMNTRGPGRTIRADFAQDRNNYHRRKATDIAHGFPRLCCLLNARLARIAAGTATEEGRP